VISRRTFVCALAGGLLATPFAAGAEQAVKPVRIGYLGLDVAAGDPRNREALLRGLRDLGYVSCR